MRVIVIVVLATILVGCASQNYSVKPQTRSLTANEKSLLAKAFSVALNDPSAARFKWMPVILNERDGITDYCGLVNGKNSHGRYVGFQKFYAHLRKDREGQLSRGEIRLIASYDISAIATDRACSQFGYTDFNEAQ